MISQSHFSAIRPQRVPTGRPRRLVLLAASGAAAVVAVTGCSGGGHGKSAATDGKALKAIKLAASTSQDVRTLTAHLSERTTGTVVSSLTGTIQVQLRPTTFIVAKFTIPSKKAKTYLEEILTNQAIYFKDPAFSRAAGKAWVSVRISQLSSKTGVSIASLLQNLEGSNPLDQTQLFTASKDVKAVGSQTVGGVATTEYAGSYSPKAAYAQLTPQLRKLLGPTLHAIGNAPVAFHVWIDAQHMIRKATDTETVNGQTFATTFEVTSVNTPVKVTLPAASEVAPLPKLIS
jgi:hypothetical protein